MGQSSHQRCIEVRRIRWCIFNDDHEQSMLLPVEQGICGIDSRVFCGRGSWCCTFAPIPNTLRAEIVQLSFCCFASTANRARAQGSPIYVKVMYYPSDKHTCHSSDVPPVSRVVAHLRRICWCLSITSVSRLVWYKGGARLKCWNTSDSNFTSVPSMP